jgi:hypothetical protein
MAPSASSNQGLVKVARLTFHGASSHLPFTTPKLTLAFGVRGRAYLWALGDGEVDDAPRQYFCDC